MSDSSEGTLLRASAYLDLKYEVDFVLTPEGEIIPLGIFVVLRVEGEAPVRLPVPEPWQAKLMLMLSPAVGERIKENVND